MNPLAAGDSQGLLTVALGTDFSMTGGSGRNSLFRTVSRFSCFLSACRRAVRDGGAELLADRVAALVGIDVVAAELTTEGVCGLGDMETPPGSEDPPFSRTTGFAEFAKPGVSAGVADSIRSVDTDVGFDAASVVSTECAGELDDPSVSFVTSSDSAGESDGGAGVADGTGAGCAAPADGSVVEPDIAEVGAETSGGAADRGGPAVGSELRELEADEDGTGGDRVTAAGGVVAIEGFASVIEPDGGG